MKPDLYALVETLEVVNMASRAGLWDQTTWINSDPIVRGELDWQGRTFCGTAGCFAGWRAILDGGDVVFGDVNLDDDFRNESLIFPDGKKIHSSGVGRWAQERFGLTEAQARELFSAENTLGDLHEIVREIVTTAMDAEIVTDEVPALV